MRFVLFLPTIAASLATTAPLLAQPPMDPAAMFAGADTNGDGLVSRAELIAKRSTLFAQVDANKDGVVNFAEFQSQARGMQGRMMARTMFSSFDADGDGKVPKPEWDAAPTPLFDRADTNQDGFVSKGELAAQGF